MRRTLLKTLAVLAGLPLLVTACEDNEIEVIDQVIQTNPELSWSASSCNAVMGADNEFPVLTNTYGVNVTYSSSDESVATISSSGAITLLTSGATSITASSVATTDYLASSASYTLNVKKAEDGISWSADECTVNMTRTDNSFPTLINPGSQEISYSSSDTSVASVDEKGSITLLAEGTTTITATAAANDTYKASSASYTLRVISSSDSGTGTYTYSSTGDPSSDDDISNTTFTRLITITYSSSGASIEGDYYGYVTASGNKVTANNTSDEYIVYKLTGSTSDGYFKLYSSSKQAILLSGVSITNPDGAAIDNQSGKRTFVMVEGSNTLSDSSSAAYSTSSDEDMKGVFFSEGQLIFSGSGSLQVNALNRQSKSGIVSDDYIRIMDSPAITVNAGSSAGHGLKANDYVQLSDGILNVTTAASMKKGINSEDYVLVEGGTHTITVSGGVAYDSEDSEYTGSAGIKADNYFGMTGGSVTIKNTGTGGKGLRAGSESYSGTLSASYISGGTLDITTSGNESNDVSSKGIKIGYKVSSGRSSTGYGDLNISGGSVSVTCSRSESIESKGDMTISGGQVYASSSADDAINSLGEMDITGGYVYAFSSSNDALDSNKDLKLSGGYVYAVSTAGNPEVAIDANTESNYKLYINSGVTVIAYGGLESGYSASQNVYSMSCTAGSWNALYDGSSFIAAFKTPSSVSSVAVSAPSLSSGYKGVSVSGTTYSGGMLATSGISGGTSVTLSTYSGGGNSGGPGGGGNQGGGPGGGGRR